MIPVQVKVNENGSLQYYLEEGDLQKLGFIKRDELNHLIKPTKTEVVHEALSLNEAMKILKKGFAKIKAMINAGVLLTTPDGRILKSSIDDYFTGDLNVYKKKK